MLPDLQRGANLGDASVAHHDDAVGQREGLALVVGDGEHGRAQAGEERAQFDDEAFAQTAVQLAQWLVQHQQPGPGRERACQGDALLLAAGERGNGPPLGAGQPHQIEEFGDLAVLLPPAHATHPQPEGDVGADVPVREQLVVLEHQAESAPVHRHPGLVRAVEQDPPAVQVLETGHHPQQRRFPAAARSQHTDDLVVRDLQIHRVQRRPVAEAHGGRFECQH